MMFTKTLTNGGYLWGVRSCIFVSMINKYQFPKLYSLDVIRSFKRCL